MEMIYDNIMKERTVKCEAHIMKKNYRRKVIVVKLKHYITFAGEGDEHYILHRQMPHKVIQLQFQFNKSGLRCLTCTEDISNKANDGSLKKIKIYYKMILIYSNQPSKRKYHILCPKFYLLRLLKPTPKQ